MKNILIVDDNKYILDTLSANLCSYLADCAIMTALDAEKGVEILRSVPVDLILTDLDLPVVKGYAFIEHAKKNYPDVPVCVMTGACAPAVQERLKVMGVSRYIGKPFQIEELANLISEELALRPKGAEPGGIGNA